MRTLTEQAAAVAAGEVRPVELVERAIAALEDVETRTNAFTHVLADQAIDEAKGLTVEGAERSERPLLGVPVVVKALYDVAGVATTGCCAAFEDRIAQRDSAVVDKLRGAGAIVIAKSNQHEMACGATGLLSSFGPVRNPWDVKRLAGGSSGGSAIAVATGVVGLAMGSDTGGSIRIPASLCGVTGLKTTHGSISLRGAMPLVPPLDSAGPIASDARDCGLAFEILAGRDPADVWSQQRGFSAAPARIEGARIAVLARFTGRASAAMRRAVEDAARVFGSLGAIVEEIDGPDPDEAWDAVGPIFISDFAARYSQLADDERAHPEVRALIEGGCAVAATDYARSVEACRAASRSFDAVLERADFLLAPATPFPAPLADETEVDIGDRTVDVRSGGLARLTIPVNVAGLPALSLPAGFEDDVLPLGVQLIGPRWSEPQLCAVGAAFQDATGWHLRTPPADARP